MPFYWLVQRALSFAALATALIWLAQRLAA
jgi:hypothetical protein